MAKANLPVNFKDDILKENMNGKRRFNMIQNSDGTVSFEDVTEYTQVGSTFGAAQINATNEAVNNAADASKIIDSLETIKANTQSGYIAGALAVKELNSNLSGKTFRFTGNSGAYGAQIEIANLKQVVQLGTDPYNRLYLYSGELNNLTLIYAHYIYPNQPIVFENLLKTYPTATVIYLSGSNTGNTLYEVTMK